MSIDKTKKYKILPVTAVTVLKNRNKCHQQIQPKIKIAVGEILNMDF